MEAVSRRTKYDLFQVTWIDACNTEDASWRDVDGVSVDNVCIHSVGYLLRKTKHYVLLAGSIDIRESSVNFTNEMQIPRRCILKITKLGTVQRHILT